jgi:hypothetical protein
VRLGAARTVVERHHQRPESFWKLEDLKRRNSGADVEAGRASLGTFARVARLAERVPAGNQ